METLDEEQPMTTVDRLVKNAKISIPKEIIEEIFSRLPVKSILRFRSVSKPWLSNISHPSFTKLHFTRATAAHRTTIFISAHNCCTRKRYLLSIADDGGPITHLLTLDNAYSNDITKAEHLNGLLCFTCVQWFFGYYKTKAFVLNPSTRKIFELPDPDIRCSYGNVLFGFNESRNEHSILMMRRLLKPAKLEMMIFSMSSYSWREIDAEPPIGFSWDSLHYDDKGGVCINSVVHLLLKGSVDILAFDLRTEKFSIISTPQSVKSHESSRRGITLLKVSRPRIIKINGCIGVVCHDRVRESHKMRIWMLQDYENGLWVREISTFLESWIELDGTSPFPFPLDVNMDEIIFCPQNRMRLSFPRDLDRSGKVSRNVMSVPIYNKRSRCLKSLQFTLGHQFLCSKNVKFDQIKCYVESMVPL